MTDDSSVPGWRTIAKAIAAAITAGLAAFITAIGDNTVSPGEWATIAIAAIGGLAIVWAVPNAGTTPTADVAAKDTGDGVEAGPAAPGIPEGAPVDVVPDGTVINIRKED